MHVHASHAGMSARTRSPGTKMAWEPTGPAPSNYFKYKHTEFRNESLESSAIAHYFTIAYYSVKRAMVLPTFVQNVSAMATCHWYLHLHFPSILHERGASQFCILFRSHERFILERFEPFRESLYCGSIKTDMAHLSYFANTPYN